MTDSFLTRWTRAIKQPGRITTKRRKAAWSSGRDEQFGGRFFCFHGLCEEECEALKALADVGLGIVPSPQVNEGQP